MSAGAFSRRSVWRFVLLVGITNLFADMTYEGARGVVGDFLGQLGASGTIVALVAGGGELAGYLIRSLSGFVADRTGFYWLDVWIGYMINMACVPALALAGTWPAAAGLVVGERIGRGIRRPAMSSILSRAGRDLGSGRIFGVNEALDQIGGAVGPLLIALLLERTNSFHISFAALSIPAVITIVFLALASASSGEAPERKRAKSSVRFARVFWIYAIGGALFAAGYADFALVAYHLGQAKIASPALVSMLYSIAKIVAAAAAPLMGLLLDRIGIIGLVGAIAISIVAVPFAFLGSGWIVGLGVALWGMGTVVQDSLLVALVAKVTPEDTRSTAYGIFDTVFGIAWLAGSAALGKLYDHFLPGLIAFSVIAQVASILVFLASTRIAPLIPAQSA